MNKKIATEILVNKSVIDISPAQKNEKTSVLIIVNYLIH